MPPSEPASNSLEVLDEVRLLDVEPFAARVRGHVRIGVDATSFDARLSQQAEELAAAAADVQHRGGLAQIVDVAALALTDRVGAAAHPALEGEVVRDGGRSRLARHGHGRLSSISDRRATPLEPLEPFLQLANEPFRLLARRCRRVGALRECIEQLEHGVVEDALVCRQRLDVPAHELSQDPFDDPLRPAARLALGGDRPETLRERPRGREFGPPRIPVNGTTSKLLAESFVQGGDVDLLRRGNTCRRRVFRLRPGHSEDCTG